MTLREKLTKRVALLSEAGPLGTGIYEISSPGSTPYQYFFLNEYLVGDRYFWLKIFERGEYPEHEAEILSYILCD